MKENSHNDTLVIEREKSQNSRLYSIFVFSGIMLYMANKKKLTKTDRAVLFVTGSLVALTVGKAYFVNRKRLEDAR
jgi:hypothetical protein